MKIVELFSGIKSMDKNSKNRIIIIIGIIGVVLIFASSIIPKNVNKKKELDGNSDINTYSTKLKNDLEYTISKIDGAGSADVFITLERGYEYIYAKTDKKTADKKESTKSNEHTADEKSTGEEEYIIVKTDNGEEPLIVTQIEPKIKGVIVVCKGGGNEMVVKKITKAVSISLGISESKICVVPKSK